MAYTIFHENLMAKIESVWVLSQDSSLSEKFKNLANIVVSPSESMGFEAPDVTVLDPDGLDLKDSVGMVEKFRNENGHVPILIYSGQSDRELVIGLLTAGARGYISKTSSEAFLSESLFDLAKGFTPLSSGPATHVLDEVLRRPSFRGLDLKLNPREIELIQFLSEGFTKQEISKKAGRNIHTIDNQIRRVYAKLGAKNLGQAVGQAYRNGIIS